MDYKELLKKYMKHVRDMTEEYHLDTLNVPMGEPFSEEEERELFEVNQEIANE